MLLLVTPVGKSMLLLGATAGESMLLLPPLSGESRPVWGKKGMNPLVGGGGLADR